MSLWQSEVCIEWAAALERYPSVIDRQASPLLERRDRWYRETLPGLIAARASPYVSRDELVWVVEWKMARGEWRARNLHLARSNEEVAVREASLVAFAAATERAAINALSTLKGVGAATASAVLGAHLPARFPFYDDVVAAQVPGLKTGDFSVKAYLGYREALVERAQQLRVACPDVEWNAQNIGFALWAAVGGKTG